MHQSSVFPTGAAYEAFVEQYCALLDQQLAVYEARAQDSSQLSALVHQLPPLISLVNTVGYMRGQDGLFLDIRPPVDNQQRLYALETAFEARLHHLIQLVLQSPYREAYQQQLQQYYVTARTS